jgi:hypothetical protein
MLDVRTLGVGLALFCATFAVVWWLGLGKSTSARETSAPPLAQVAAPPSAAQPELPELKPKLTAFAKASAPPPTPAATGTAKGLTEDEGLRQAVILRAKAYLRPICNQDSRTLYVNAATKYAEVLMRAAGCSNFPKCPIGEGNIGNVWRLNRSAADEAVATAMAAVHAAGGLSDKQFRGDVGRAVRVIAGGNFHSGPAPACESAQARSSGNWRIRVRR